MIRMSETNFQTLNERRKIWDGRAYVFFQKYYEIFCLVKIEISQLSNLNFLIFFVEVCSSKHFFFHIRKFRNRLKWLGYFNVLNIDTFDWLTKPNAVQCIQSFLLRNQHQDFVKCFFFRFVCFFQKALISVKTIFVRPFELTKQIHSTPKVHWTVSNSMNVQRIHNAHLFSIQKKILQTDIRKSLRKMCNRCV